MDIWRYIAADNPNAADRMLDRFDAKLATLADYSEMGRARPELGRGIRSIAIGNYVAYYRILPKGVDVVRVLSGYMDTGPEEIESGKD